MPVPWFAVGWLSRPHGDVYFAFGLVMVVCQVCLARELDVRVKMLRLFERLGPSGGGSFFEERAKDS
jgi:hypothetical protein